MKLATSNKTFNHIITVSALLFVLALNGAMPFFGLPTLGQAVWSTGFSHSFINDSIFNVYARNFGQPEPAAISFGLSGAWPAAILINFGMHASDAYATVAALWFSISFFSALKLCKQNKLGSINSALAATLWMSMPIIFAHSNYSMLSFGIALLPFYFLTTLNLISSHASTTPHKATNAIALCITATISVFMDGYTFVMFACGAWIYLAYTLFTDKPNRRHLIIIVLPTYIFSFSIAYALYTKYIGKSDFDQAPIDFFRGWGADVAFFLSPSKGVHWLFDFLNLSIYRTSQAQFGDASVWTTTFCLPILIVGLLGWWKIRKHDKLTTGILLLAIFGFYMSLGPSLKLFSTKPLPMQLNESKEHVAMMAEQYALMPTGNKLIYQKLPGFKAMRASYRWAALGIFGLWWIAIRWFGNISPNKQWSVHILLVILIILNLPNLYKKLDGYNKNRASFFAIDEEPLQELSSTLKPGERVVFLPYRNDFLLNYLASRLDIQTYNIGGDKNLVQAKKDWPFLLKKFKMAELDESDTDRIALILLKNHSDVVVIPYFDALWGAHSWPCDAEDELTVNERMKATPHLGCPSFLRPYYAPIIQSLKRLDYLTIHDSYLFATIRLAPEIATAETKNKLYRELLKEINYPISTNKSHSPRDLDLVLIEGWYPAESNFTWSSPEAYLNVPVPAECESKSCFAEITFGVFSATTKEPKQINMSRISTDLSWNTSSIFTQGAAHKMRLPLKSGSLFNEFRIDCPNATSPAQLKLSADARYLCISLEKIDLITE